MRHALEVFQRALFSAVLLVAHIAYTPNPAHAADITFSCTPDPTPGTDDRASQTLNISATTTIQVNNCSFAYTSGSVSPAMSGTYIAGGQLFTISGAGSLNVYVAGSYGKVWTITSSIATTPSNSSIPTLSGTLRNGQVLSTTNGSWSGSPTSFSYQWQRASTSNGTYSDISGATSSTYTLTVNDIGQFLKSKVTATNSAGSSFALSAASTQVGKSLQSPLSFTSSSTSKSYPYSSALVFSPLGGSGTGVISYAIAAGGTASGCSLSGDTSTVTLSASSAGTCLLQATKASDAGYESATSSALTFTFSKSVQQPIVITTTSANYGSNLSLSISGGSTGGSPNYRVSSGSCTVSGSILAPTNVGSCVITANLPADSNYFAETSTATTVTISRGVSTASLGLDIGNPVYRQTKNISFTASSAGKVTFQVNGKNLPRCIKLSVNSGNVYTATCPFKPSTNGVVRISAIFFPSDPLINGTTVVSAPYAVSRRSSLR